MTSSRLSSNLEKTSRLLWGLVLLTLPVTSFRFFPFLGKNTYVRPLAFYPLALLYLVLFLRLLRKETKLPWSNALLPLLLFLIFSLFATAGGALLAPIPLRGNDYWGRALRAFITFGIGLAFFLATLWMHRDENDLQHSLKWLYAGLALTIGWVALQATALHTPLLKKSQVSAWQMLFSVRGMTKVKRVSGFAFEASWLAGQLVTLYLPWLVASLITRFRVTKHKWLEPTLLLGVLAALMLTFSRGGLLIAIIATGITFLFAGRKAIGQAFGWFLAPFKAKREERKRAKNPETKKKNFAHSASSRVILLLLIVGVLFGSLSFLAQQNYVARLWQVEAKSLSDYFVQINAGGRLTYAWAAAQVFGEHPLIGTGIGSSGFYLYPKFPNWALYNNPEIAQLLDPTSGVYTNPKNLYLRLLAETGIIGFAIIGIFFLAILAEAGKAFRESNKMLGAAGLYTWVAVLIYYLMQDSFAMAELWINFGILLGITSHLNRKKL